MITRSEITIIEVGPRDGLQNLNFFVPTATKISLIKQLATCGIKEIQVGAFVSPRAIPQFSDMEEVIENLKDLGDTKLNVLVPNVKGAVTAVSKGIKELVFFYSLSESHNQNNVNQSRDESLRELKVIKEEFATEKSVDITVALATVFGCPFEGYIPNDEIVKYIEKTVSLGIRKITLCDTVGYAHPALVEEILSLCFELFPTIEFALHLHNTRGLGLANALKAYEMGIRRFDAALGGLGGCPFAPGATGNIATEDIVFMFNSMGCATDIDLNALLKVTHYLQESIPGIITTSAVYHAGLPKSLS
ncbi:MAG: hydroxymethylglutaryl-CoA lyase [Syntrophales bacterium]|nr:hydroxymethylglutaryl-CoA lyase [Syntrophales bacterium]